MFSSKEVVGIGDPPGWPVASKLLYGHRLKGITKVATNKSFISGAVYQDWKFSKGLCFYAHIPNEKVVTNQNVGKLVSALGFDR